MLKMAFPKSLNWRKVKDKKKKKEEDICFPCHPNASPPAEVYDGKSHIYAYLSM